MTVHLVTFAADNMSRSRELCVESAKRHGVDVGWEHGPEVVHGWPAVKNNPEVFTQPTDARRAWAWWAWKPLIIDQFMQHHNDGQICIYSDAGVEFINNVNYIIDRMDQDIFLFGNNWEHAHWCKRDVIEAVWPSDGDRWLAANPVENAGAWGNSVAEGVRSQSWLRFGKQVQASVIFFRVSDYTRKFVKEWLDWCLFEGGRLIDDSPSRAPNHPEFREHRHDQAILTTLAYREGIKLHWWPSVYNKGGSPEFVYEKLPEYAGDDYPILFSHHRKRDREWTT